MILIQKEIKDQYIEVMGQALGILVLLPESPKKENLRVACQQFFDRQVNLGGDSCPTTLAEVSGLLAKIDSLVQSLVNTTHDSIIAGMISSIAHGFDCRGADVAEKTVVEHAFQGSCGKLMKVHVCPVCGAEFQSNRQDAQYCGVKCKQAAYRERKKSPSGKDL